MTWFCSLSQRKPTVGSAGWDHTWVLMLLFISCLIKLPVLSIVVGVNGEGSTSPLKRWVWFWGSFIRYGD